MKSSKVRLMLLSLALITGAIAQERLQDRHEDKRDAKEGRHRFSKEVQKELGLTDQQRQQLQGIRQEQKRQTQAIRNDSTLTQEQRREKARQLHLSSQERIKGILTLDQQQKMAQFREKMRERKGDRREDGTERHRRHRRGGFGGVPSQKN